MAKCDEEGEWDSRFSVFDSVDVMTLASAIINGYTVEQTPEEKVREYFTLAKEDAESGDYDRIFTGEAKVEAVEFFAKAYGIKIEGVNA
jgi:hypothetical protein